MNSHFPVRVGVSQLVVPMNSVINAVAKRKSRKRFFVEKNSLLKFEELTNEVTYCW